MPLHVRNQPPLRGTIGYVEKQDFEKLLRDQDIFLEGDDEHGIDQELMNLKLPHHVLYCLDEKGSVWYRELSTRTWFADDQELERSKAIAQGQEPKRPKESLWFSRGESVSTFTDRIYREAQGQASRPFLTKASARSFVYVDQKQNVWRVVAPHHIHLDSSVSKQEHPYVKYHNDKIPVVTFGHELVHVTVKGAKHPLLFYLSQRIGCWMRLDGSEERLKLLLQLRAGRRQKRLRPKHEGYPIHMLLGELYFLDSLRQCHFWNEDKREWENSKAPLSAALSRLKNAAKDYQETDIDFRGSMFLGSMKDFVQEFPVLRLRMDQDNEFDHHLWLFTEWGKPEASGTTVRRHAVRYLRHYRILKTGDGEFYWSYDIPASPNSPAGEQRGLKWNSGGFSVMSLRRALVFNDQRRTARIAPLESFDELIPYELYEDSRGTLFYAHENGDIGLWNAERKYWLNTEMKLRPFQEFMLNLTERHGADAFVSSRSRLRHRGTPVVQQASRPAPTNLAGTPPAVTPKAAPPTPVAAATPPNNLSSLVTPLQFSNHNHTPHSWQRGYLMEEDFRRLYFARTKNAAENTFESVHFEPVSFQIDAKGSLWYQSLFTRSWFDRFESSLWFSRGESKDSFTDRMYRQARGRWLRPNRQYNERPFDLVGVHVPTVCYFHQNENQYVYRSAGEQLVFERNTVRSECGIPYLLYPDAKVWVAIVHYAVVTNEEVVAAPSYRVLPAHYSGHREPLLLYLSQRLGCWTHFNGDWARFQFLQRMRLARRWKGRRPTYYTKDGKRCGIDLLLGELYFVDDEGQYHSWNEKSHQWVNTRSSLKAAIRRRVDEINDLPSEGGQGVLLRFFVDEDNEFSNHMWLARQPDRVLSRYPIHFVRHYKILQVDGQYFWSLDLPESPDTDHTGQKWTADGDRYWYRGEPASAAKTEQAWEPKWTDDKEWFWMEGRQPSSRGAAAGPQWHPGGSSPRGLLRILRAQDEQRSQQAASLETFKELKPYELHLDLKGTLFYAHDTGEIEMWNPQRNCWLNTDLPLIGFQEFMLSVYADRRGTAPAPLSSHRGPQPAPCTPEPFSYFPTKAAATNPTLMPKAVLPARSTPESPPTQAPPKPSQTRPQPTQQTPPPPLAPKQESKPAAPVEPPPAQAPPPKKKAIDLSRFGRLDIPDKTE